MSLMFRFGLFPRYRKARSSGIFSSDDLVFVLLGIFFHFSGWLILKYYFPFPQFSFDSYIYVQTAIQNDDVGYWPVGYSKFIRLVGFISHSANLIVNIQFVLLSFSFHYFFFSFRKIFCISKMTSVLLFIFLFINPLYLFANNYILSDILFTSLTLVWFTHLLWLVNKPNPNPISWITHIFLLTVVFTIRYSAVYFPVVSLIAVLLVKQKFYLRLMSISLLIISLGSFIVYTSDKMVEYCGVRQFSFASGWKQACNALFMYENIFREKDKDIPREFVRLDSVVIRYFNSEHQRINLMHLEYDRTAGGFYITTPGTPLIQYMEMEVGQKVPIYDFEKFAPWGKLYYAYGNFLIFRYPIEYCKYVILPYILTYFYPLEEVYGRHYDLFGWWDASPGEMTRRWFNIESLSIPPKYIETRFDLLSPYPLIFTIIHFLFFSNLVYFSLRNGFRRLYKSQKIVVNLLIIFCVIHFLFTVVSAASVLRFQFVIIIIEFSGALFFIELLTNPQKIDNHH